MGSKYFLVIEKIQEDYSSVNSSTMSIKSKTNSHLMFFMIILTMVGEELKIHSSPNFVEVCQV